MVQLSIIVPFFNARVYLPKLLSALSAQDLPRAEFEVLLVDNASSDGSDALAGQLLREHELPGSVLRYAETQSSYGARNVGVVRARGKFLLFTDADCAPDPVWARRALEILAANPGCVLSGAVDLEVVDRRNVWENFDKLAHMRNEVRAARNEIATANMGVRREDFLRVGPFDETRSGGDFAWSRRAARCGLGVKYCPDVRVGHPTRKTRGEIEAKLRRLAYGEGQLFRKRQRSLVLGMAINLARCVNLKVYCQYSYWMLRTVGASRVAEFNLSLFAIRLRNLENFLRGYYGIAPREPVV